MKIIYIFLVFLLIGCAEETLFTDLNDIVRIEDILKNDPALPIDDVGPGNICLIDPGSPLCYTFCELYPNSSGCTSLPDNDCSVNPNLDICQSLCQLFPYHNDCIQINYCEKYPGAIECSLYCLAFPSDPDCSLNIDCFDTPEHSACKLFCELYPFEEICQNNNINDPEYVSNTEIFVQNVDNNQVDIIWIVDNSGSMKNDQTNLANNFPVFIDGFLQMNSHFKMGITTTDTTGVGSVFRHDGEFLGGVPVLTSEMDINYVRQHFINNIKVGTSGSGRERGLEAVVRAINKNNEPSSNNYNFIRENAFLAIIVVTDENDISPNSTYSYIEAIKATKNDLDKVAVYGILDIDSTSYFDPYYYPVDLQLYMSNPINPGGLRYMTAVNETGGFYESIGSNFANSLLNIGTGITELIQNFNLEYTPLINTIEVKVNGNIIVKDDISGWSYDENHKAIKFNGISIPQTGAEIEVKYTYLM